MKRYATVDEVTDVVQSVFGIKNDIRKMKGVLDRINERGERIYRPSYITHRKIAMYFCRWYTATQYKKIAAKFGIKTGTVIINNANTAKGLLEIGDREFAPKMKEIDRILSESYLKRPGEKGYFKYHKYKLGINQDVVLDMVCRVYGIKDNILNSRGVVVRVSSTGTNVYSPSYVMPRMVAMYLCYKHTPLTKQEILTMFNVTSESAVNYAIRKVNDMIDIKDKMHYGKITRLKNDIESLTKTSVDGKDDSDY